MPDRHPYDRPTDPAKRHSAALTDGPYAEAKEMVAGFYLIEARDLNEAVQVASRLPSAPLGVVEVRPCRDLEVGGVPHKASRKTRTMA